MTTRTETFSGMAARVKDVQKGMPADRIGLLPGDVILKLGKHEPIEGVEMPSVLDDLSGSHEWIVVQRDTIIFRISPVGGAMGAVLEAYPLPADIVLETEGPWTLYHCCMRPNDAMILIPDRISPAWWPIPLIAYGYFRLWQMAAATVFLYGISFVVSQLAFGVVYVASVMILITGGPYLLRDTAYKDGYHPRGRLAIGKRSDVAALEMVTGALLRLQAKQK
jgi:hypothetical protein